MNSKLPESKAVPPAVSQNIEIIGDYYKRADRSIGRLQRSLERLGDGIGRPLFFVAMAMFVALWVLVNELGPHIGIKVFDPPPFAALQTIVSVVALGITTIVLIGQNREAKLEQRRAQMELQVNILTEQKTTTLIRLLEELRRDLPMVRDRHDPDAATLQQRTDPTSILSALEKDRNRQLADNDTAPRAVKSKEGDG
jgi:uncharacterized membrane protein